MTLEVRRLTASIGAEVSGLDLAQKLDADQIRAVREALLAHQVLVFRNQDLTPESHIAFAEYFGTIKCPPVPTAHGGPPEINVLDQTDPRGEGADAWHADNTYTTEPPMGSLLRILQLPSVGGDTAFASMYAAYEALSPEIRRLCDGLTAIHDVTRSLTKAIARGHSVANLAELQERLPPVEHPVVIVHPETGRRALFVNTNSTERIVGFSDAESDMLLRFLFEHTKNPEFQVRVRWDTQTLVFLDNRCTQHYAIADYRERRILHRVAVEGSDRKGFPLSRSALGSARVGLKEEGAPMTERTHAIPAKSAAQREDENQLRDLAYRYAQMMDRRDFDMLPQVFAEDGRLIGPGYEMQGFDVLRQGLAALEQFSATLHGVLNTYFEVDGDAASGEVYCVANHVYEKEGVPFKLDMGIRYEDVYARAGAGWVIQSRKFNMVWETDRPMSIDANGQALKAE